jgi:hypothetical protein
MKGNEAMRITAKQLNFATARTKREIFNHLFPGGADVSLANARRATAGGLSLRCASEQLMDEDQLAEFNRRASDLLNDYRMKTADTLCTLRSLDPFRNKMEWIEAEASHEEAKQAAWEPYLDGLAVAFVEVLQAE